MPETYLSADAIDARVRELGEEVRGRGGEGTLVLTGVLKGAAVFFADLARAVPGPTEFAFMRARSYGDRTESAGEVVVDVVEPETLQERDIVLVDTILDTGHTLRAVRERVFQAGASSVLTCVLLDKPSRREIEIEADLVGFTVPDRFLVGYGLDHAGQFRGLRDLAVL
ncbi:MAG: phosphoribosyltransferase [Planctomycetota bacterium]|jgi:hypoxanthine phosphoribosyltransferase